MKWKLKRLQLLLVVLAVIVVALVIGRSHLVFLPNALARRSIGKRDLANAQAWLEHSRALSPSDAETEFLWARIARREGRMADVRTHLAEARRRGYSPAALDREKWLAFAQAGQMKEAEPHMAELLVNPQGDAIEICEAFVIGFLKRHSLDRARELLRGWSADFPSDPVPHHYLGLIEQDLGAWDSAIGHYEAGLRASAKHAECALGLGACYLEKKQPQRALEYYDLATKLDGDSIDALVGQARCLRAAGRAEEARRALTRAIEIDSQHAEATLELAQVELEAGEYEAAGARLEPLVEREPRNHDARFAYATALRSTSRMDEATEQFAMVREAREHLLKAKNAAAQIKSPDDIEARAEVGMIYLKFGNPTEGLFWLTSVLDRAPRHKPTHSALAAYYFAKQDEDPRFLELAKHHQALSQD